MTAAMKIRQLHDFVEGVSVEVAPVTIPDAVVDPNTQENLTTILDSLKESVPTKTSELENDAEYMTKEAVDEGYLSLAGGDINGFISFYGNSTRIEVNEIGGGGRINFVDLGPGFFISSKNDGDVFSVYNKYVGINNNTPYYNLDVNGSIGTNTDVFIKDKSVSGFISFYEGSNTATSLSSVPVDKRLCVCTVSASGSFSLASVPAAGREVHVIVSNTGDSDIAVALPNTGEYVCLTDAALSVKAGGYAEINVISDGSRMYIRSI